MSDPGSAARPFPAPSCGPENPQEPRLDTPAPGDVWSSTAPSSRTCAPANRSVKLRAHLARYRPTRRGSRIVGAFLLAGLALAGLWGVLTPSLREASDQTESAIATDGTLLLLQVLAGLLTGAALLRRPGPDPSRRLLETIALSALGSVAGWFVVDHFTSAGPLNAPGVLLVWPLATSALVTVGSVRVLFRQG
jgi:hypothetical protein